jgi:hypothetical protein
LLCIGEASRARMPPRLAVRWLSQPAGHPLNALKVRGLLRCRPAGGELDASSVAGCRADVDRLSCSALPALAPCHTG